MRVDLILTTLQICFSLHSIWIDCDPSIDFHDVDDGFALWQSFLAPTVQVVGVSTVFGNDLATTTLSMAQKLVDVFSNRHLEVFQGALSKNDLGRPTAASVKILEAAASYNLTIVALGPLTNIATAVMNDISNAFQTTQVIAVAGRRKGVAFKVGRTKQLVRDLNFELDIESFRVILLSHIPLTLIPFELSSSVTITSADIHFLSSALVANPHQPTIQWLLNSSLNWIRKWENSFNISGFHPFDTLAVGYVISPDIFSCYCARMVIEEVLTKSPSVQQTEIGPFTEATYTYPLANISTTTVNPQLIAHPCEPTCCQRSKHSNELESTTTTYCHSVQSDVFRHSLLSLLAGLNVSARL
jgi:inosine-uridine nucleoside N-ribohydrolase